MLAPYEEDIVLKQQLGGTQVVLYDLCLTLQATNTSVYCKIPQGSSLLVKVSQDRGHQSKKCY